MKSDEKVKFPEQVVLEQSSCPMGCPSGERHVLRGRDRLHDLPGEFEIVQCSTCGLMRTNPRPTRDTIGFYYPAGYGPHQQAVRSEPLGRLNRFLRAVRSWLIEFNTERIPSLKPGRLFEIGCGGGGFIQKMAATGWTVEGLELAEAPVRRLREAGYDIHQTSLEDFDAPAIPPDIVVGWMVLEHLYDPLGGLRKVHSWLSRDGWLVLSVPNESVGMAHWTGDAWYNRQLPSHLTHFDTESVRNMLEKGGFRVERIFHQRVIGSLLATLGNVLDDRNMLPRVSRFFKRAASSTTANYAFYPLGWLLAAIGQTGRITVWARKK